MGSSYPDHTDLPPPHNHVFVDFENVHTIAPEIIGNKTVTFTLLLGAKQTRLDAALVEQLMTHASSVHLVRLTSSGKNALDFTLAYYVGRAVAADPAGFFHIVAKDKGYDALVEHLRSRHVRAHRHDDFSALRFSGTTKTKVPPAESPPVAKETPASGISAAERAQEFLEHIRTHPNNRPKRRSTLLSHIKTHFGNKLADSDADAIIQELERGGQITINDKAAVTYRL